jgi:hypothetical protein
MMLKTWMNRLVFLVLTGWFVYALLFYLFEELTVSYQDIDYSIVLDSETDVSFDYSFNISPGEFGSIVKTVSLNSGIDTLNIPVPKYNEVVEIYLHSQSPVNLSIKSIYFANTINKIQIDGEALVSNIQITSTDLESSIPVEYTKDGISISLDNQLAIISIKGDVLVEMHRQLIYWQKTFAIVFALLYLLIMLVLFSVKKRSWEFNNQANFCLMFLVILFTPLITQKNNRYIKNSILEPFPDLNVNIWRIPSQYNKYYNDHFPFRNEFRQLGNYIKYNLFGISPRLDFVQLGKDGWLFYSPKVVVKMYQGVELYSIEQLEKIRTNLEQTAGELEAKGITYYLVIPPVKHQVYSEYLPKALELIGTTNKRKQLMEYLNENSSIKLIDPKSTLMDLKKSQVVYDKTDTHWNRIGAFSVYQLIINRIRVDYPQIEAPLQLSDFNVKKEINFNGDLVTLLDIQNTFSRESYIFQPKNQNNKKILKVGEMMEGEIDFVYYENEDKSKPRLLLYRDSYSEHLRPFISEHFSYTGVVWSRHLGEQRINQEKPDIIIHEILDRFMDELLIEH